MFDSLNLFSVDIIGLFASMALLKGAITGEFYSVGRGGRRTPIAKISSVPARAAFLLVAGGLTAWVVQDFLHKIGR